MIEPHGTDLRREGVWPTKRSLARLEGESHLVPLGRWFRNSTDTVTFCRATLALHLDATVVSVAGWAAFSLSLLVALQK